MNFTCSHSLRHQKTVERLPFQRPQKMFVMEISSYLLHLEGEKSSANVIPYPKRRFYAQCLPVCLRCGEVSLLSHLAGVVRESVPKILDAIPETCNCSCI